MRIAIGHLAASVSLALCAQAMAQSSLEAAAGHEQLDWIEVSGEGFVKSSSGEPWIPHGYNYTTNNAGDDQRLIEEIWETEWPTVASDFREMAEREANLVRYHLQLGTYMTGPATTDEAALDRLEVLAQLAEENGLYLMLVGLGGYRVSAEPEWYAALDEQGRWDVQAMFWRAVAERMAKYPSVMSYDLINEPVAVGGNSREADWWTGELDGLSFVQRINLDGGGRSENEVAETWTRKMIDAIRSADTRHPITIGALPFPGYAFGPENAGRLLDFTSPHFYPNSDGKSVPQAVAEQLLLARAFAAAGKPVLVGETYPLQIGERGFEYFVRGAKQYATGFVSHYFGRTEPEHDPENLVQSVQLRALEQWVRLGPVLKQPAPGHIPLYRYAGPWDDRYDTREDAAGFGYAPSEELGALMSYQDGQGRALCEGVDADSGRYALYADCSLPDGVAFTRTLGWMPPAGETTSPVFRYSNGSADVFTRTRNDDAYAFRGFSYLGELGQFYAPSPPN